MVWFSASQRRQRGRDREIRRKKAIKERRVRKIEKNDNDHWPPTRKILIFVPHFVPVLFIETAVFPFLTIPHYLI